MFEEIIGWFKQTDGTLDRIEDKLDRVLGQTTAIDERETDMALDLSALTAAVAAEETVEQSVITLLQNINAELLAAQGDPAAIAAIVAQIQSDTATLSAAVVANTPAAPAAQ